MTSPPPPLRASTYHEPSRSARNKHEISLNSPVMQPMQSMKFASRKRFRSDSTYVRPQKATRVSRKSFYRLAKSSPDTKGHLTALIAAAPIPGTPSVYHQPSDEETGFDLPLHNSQNVSSMIGPSPPRTPPQQKKAAYAQYHTLNITLSTMSHFYLSRFSIT